MYRYPLCAACFGGSLGCEENSQQRVVISAEDENQQVIERTFIQIMGPPGAGKTTLATQVIRSAGVLVTAVRCIQDNKLRQPKESSPKGHSELARYKLAGAQGAVLYQFPEGYPDYEALYDTQFMADYSEVILFEGDPPVDSVDLVVFVAPVIQPGGSILRRVKRDRAAEQEAKIVDLENLLREPDGAKQFLEQMMGGSIAGAIASNNSDLDEEFRAIVEKAKAAAREAPPPAPTEQWAIAAGYEGIEQAQVVVFNQANPRQQEIKSAKLGEVARLRKDREVFDDVIGIRGQRTPVTAVVADLSDPRDPGLRKAVNRIKRAMPN